MRKQASLKNKIILITGGTSGIGFATAKKVIQEEAHAIIVGRNMRKIKNACRFLGTQATGFFADVSLNSELNKLFSYIKKNFGQIHGVVINAGTLILEPFHEVTEESFDAAISTNFRGAFFTAQKSANLIQSGGSMVFVSSLIAERTSAGASIYAASKAAIISIAETLALELASRKIRVNSVSPGAINTPILNKSGMTKNEIAEHLTLCKKRIPLGRAGKACEIANIIAFLLSNESSYITGTNLRADGGFYFI